MSDWAGKTIFITGATGFLGGAMDGSNDGRGCFGAHARVPGGEAS